MASRSVPLERFLPNRAQDQRPSHQMATNGESRTSNVPEWIIQMDNELPKSQAKTTLEHAHKNEKKACIYRFDTPANLEGSCTPLKVKFSPYYHTPQSITNVKETAKPALVALLGRGRQLSDYFKAVEGVLEELKMSYEQLDPVWENNNGAFLELLFLSGCYLLELLRCIADDPSSEYLPDNPLLRVREEPGDYKHDMLLLQNQLPMRLLIVLLKAEGCDSVTKILGKYITKAFSLGKLPTDIYVRQGKHILDAVRKAIVGKDLHDFMGIRKQSRVTTTGSHFNLPSATELDKVGIRVTTSDTTLLTNISFERRTLKIPQISIDAATISRFHNMIIFEKLNKKVGNEVTSYMYFMQFLAREKEDFNLLHSCGVINTTKTIHDVAQIFGSMINDAQLDSDHLSKPYFQVGRMLKKRHDELSVEWKKDLRRNYLKSPWAIISVVAAIILFSLAAIQTVFTVLSYVHPK